MLHGTNGHLSALTEQFEHDTGRLQTDTDNQRSTLDEEADQEGMAMQTSRLTATMWLTPANTRTESHSNGCPNKSLNPTYRHMSCTHCLLHEDCTNTESHVTDEQERAIDDKGHSTAANSHCYSEVTFHCRTDGATFPGLGSPILCEERSNTHMSYHKTLWANNATTLTTASSTCIKRILMNLELIMRDLMCSGEN